MGQKQKTERKKRKRPNDGNNNGQAMHGALKHAWRRGVDERSRFGSKCSNRYNEMSDRLVSSSLIKILDLVYKICLYIDLQKTNPGDYIRVPFLKF